MKTRSDGESHQDENIIHRGDNPFEQSLYETWGIFSRVESIQYFIMYTLLKELAAHDGLNSPKHQFLLELQEKHVLDDATEVLTIFNLSLLDLDENWSDNNRKNMFVEYEAPKRAEQIAAYNCFHIEKKYPFDELGRLIMLHGVFVLEKWTGNSLTVSFNNGASYILLDSFGEHKIFKAARSCDDLQNQKQQDSKIFIMKQESKVNTFIDYDKLEFSNINLHVIPCCYGDGRWNGKKSPQEEGPWHWHRVFLDFYLNLDNVSWGKSSYGQKVEFDINYEIHHITLDSSIIIASETLHYQQELQNINKNDGLFFRVFTLPFYTDHDTTRSDYQLNLKVISKEKKFITKYAFSVQDKQYELLVLDTMPTNVSGIPLCQDR
ncbi:MAG: hypothetical protein PHU88_08530, partial [candidate division Zixibacteria bacterium]|nr:hypothetical protein [candidate division Zixibacteria bacterium]